MGENMVFPTQEEWEELHLFEPEPEPDCDHSGYRKRIDNSRSPDPVLVAETVICSNCNQIAAIRLRPPR